MPIRDRLLTFLFAHTHRPYAALKRREPWNLTPLDLVRMRPGSLGAVLGHYLLEQGFELMPKLESHDVAHLLTGTPTDVRGEIALQFLLFGNGKRSPYLLGVLLAGLLLYPGSWDVWGAAYRRGQAMGRFHDLAFRALLDEPFVDLLNTLGLCARRAAG